MDTLDAQCLVVEAIGKHMRPPDLWRHERSGELSCAYQEGQNTFTWPTADVAKMASDWRRSDRDPPEMIASLVATHRRLVEVLDGAGKAPADAIVHDLPRREIRARWEDRKVVVVVDGIPEHLDADIVSS
jgi:hypothetical protein